MKIFLLGMLLLLCGRSSLIAAEILPLFGGVSEDNKAIVSTSWDSSEYKLEFENRHDEVLLKSLKKSIRDAPEQLLYGPQIFIEGRHAGNTFVVSDWFLLSPFYELDQNQAGAYGDLSKVKKHSSINRQCFLNQGRQPSAELKQALEQRTLRGKCRKLVTLDFAEGDKRCYDAKNTFVASLEMGSLRFGRDCFMPNFIYKHGIDLAASECLDTELGNARILRFVQGEFRANGSFLLERWFVVEPFNAQVDAAGKYRNEKFLSEKLMPSPKGIFEFHQQDYKKVNWLKYRAKFVPVQP